MINQKSFNRSIAESLFNLAKNNIAQLTDEEGSAPAGRESNMFAETFDTVDSVTPIPQVFIGDGVTTEFPLSATPARGDLIDVYVESVLQRTGEVYEVQDNIIIFTETPLLGMDIYIKFR